MKWGHALGFFGYGMVLLALPGWVPELCPRNGFDGSSGRELWLQVMGASQLAVGGGWIAWQVAGLFVVAFETWPQVLAEVLGKDEADPTGALAALPGARAVPLELTTRSGWDERSAA